MIPDCTPVVVHRQMVAVTHSPVVAVVAHRFALAVHRDLVPSHTCTADRLCRSASGGDTQKRRPGTCHSGSTEETGPSTDCSTGTRVA